MSHRTRILVICLAIVALIAAVPAVVNGAPLAQVTGTVLGSDSHPIPGATVSVSSINRRGASTPVAELTADASGQWAFSGRDGTYAFVITAPSADAFSAVRTISRRSTTVVDATLQCYGAISGIVRKATTGEPLQDATVEILARVDGGWATTPTAEVPAPDGAFTSPPIPTGTYAVRASAPGFEPSFYGGAEPMPIEVDRGASIGNIQPTLIEPAPPGPVAATISGSITSAAGAGIHGLVSFARQNPDSSWPTTFSAEVWTEANGTYVSPDLALGTYRVRFFGVHNGVQWWRYVSVFADATSVVLNTGGMSVTGISAIYPPPAP